MLNLKQIINNSRILNSVRLDDIDGFGGAGGGGAGSSGGTGSGGGSSGGTGGAGSGTTSGIVVPIISITPNTNQTIAVGVTTCFTVGGSISFPMEAEQTAVFTANCNTYSGGTWTKACGSNYTYDAETLNPTLLHRSQPFHIVAYNTLFSTPGTPNNNTSTIIGVKSTGGYYFYWEVFKYCNATAGNCSSRWYAYAKVRIPNGTVTTLRGGFVEQNQQFKVKSDGNNIVWEFTTEGNWAYNYYTYTIPSDSGNLQFFVDGMFLGNTWSNIRTYRGSYQGEITSFTWTSTCAEALVITGNRACYTPLVPGSCQICVSTPGAGPLCVNVLSVPLYLLPVDRVCSSCS